MPNAEGTPAAPTGCFKCGRPGHWSRDCPSSSATNSNPIPNSNARPNTTNYLKQPSAAKAPIAAVKKVPRSRPKLTQVLLLSDDGLGYVLRHFPRAFKYHGRGHEVSDLGNLIGMYAEWHSHLIPYYSFDQFIRKVEQIGASRRVRRCIDEIKERVARGGDPTKLHEPPVELVDPDKEPEQCENEHMNVEEPVVVMEDPPLEDHGGDHIQEEMINEIYQKATDDSGGLPQQKSSETPQVISASGVDPMPAISVESSNHTPHSEQRELRKIQITEQRARMEANRLKALERAKQACSSKAPFSP
ncbi:hypothetical protein KFK09_010750 [Dendrobium nobile]|uniref:CCHC-type domain-containing protein n=1 Tax=Dendrobium nobile TaxID=94219 RepID=A0A8T3BD15_DENNO|nr:hypothetical protein KFK09_010750 [Dendrobium nobile]